MSSLKKIAVTWIELLLLAVLVIAGMAASAFISEKVGEELKENAKSEQGTKNREQKKAEFEQQAKLTAAQAELKVVQDKLYEQRLAQNQQSARVTALLALYPALNAATASSNASKVEPPEEVRKALLEAQLDEKTKGELVSKLVKTRNELLKTAQIEDGALSALQEEGKEKAEKAKENLSADTKRTVLIETARWVGGGLAAAWLLLFILCSLSGFIRKRDISLAKKLLPVFFVATSVLAILVGHQIYQMLGAAVAGAIPFLAMMIVLAGQGPHE